MSQKELVSLDQEFQELENEFGELVAAEGDFDAESAEELSALDEEIGTAGLVEESSESFDVMSMASEGTEGAVEIQFVRRFFKRKVRRLLIKLIRLIKRNARRCRKCIPLLVKAIRLFRRRRYFAAMFWAFRTFRCARSCLR